MSDPSEPKSSELSHVYREAGWPEPSRQIDEAILAASRRAAAQRSPTGAFLRRWSAPFALAATVLLTFTLVLRVYQEPPGLVSPPSPAPSAAQPAPPTEKPKSAAETKPALPAQAAPAVALKKEAPEATRADRLRRELEESMRARYQSEPPQELQAEIRPEPMRAPLRTIESPSPQAAPGVAVVPGGAAAVGAVSIRRSDAPERAPQAWLEDIRKLRAQGQTEEAGRELAEFRKRYPDYALPDDLR